MFCPQANVCCYKITDASNTGALTAVLRPGDPQVSYSRKGEALIYRQWLVAEVFGTGPVTPQNPATKPGISWGSEQWFSYIFTHEKLL